MPYAEAGGISLHYQEAGQGGVPALLLHELGGNSESWASALKLIGATRRAIAVDLRCSGRSEKPPGRFSIEDCARDLDAFLGALGLTQVDVIGAALGSLVGAVLAIQHPARVRRLMMCAVSDDLGGVTADYLIARSARVRVEGMRAVVESSLKNAFPDAFAAERASYRAIYLANQPDAYAELSLALTRLSVDWGRIAAPTLVASGAHDFIWPPDHGRTVAAMIPGAGFTILTEAGHFPHMQTPRALAELAASFLA